MFTGLPDIMEHRFPSPWTRRGRISITPGGTGNPVTASYENRQNSIFTGLPDILEHRLPSHWISRGRFSTKPRSSLRNTGNRKNVFGWRTTLTLKSISQLKLPRDKKAEISDFAFLQNEISKFFQILVRPIFLINIKKKSDNFTGKLPEILTLIFTKSRFTGMSDVGSKKFFGSKIRLATPVLLKKKIRPIGLKTPKIL